MYLCSKNAVKNPIIPLITEARIYQTPICNMSRYEPISANAAVDPLKKYIMNFDKCGVNLRDIPVSIRGDNNPI